VTRVMAYRRDGEGVMTGEPQLALPIDVKQEGEIRTYRIVFPYLPPSKNEYENWPVMWKSSAKQKWVNAVKRAVDEQMIPSVAKVGLAATLVFPSRARRDPQNYAQALWHWVPDGLVRAGVIPDDDEGKIAIGPNWGVTMAVDTRSGPKDKRKRTILSISMFVPEG
jgi:hypothetical protein